MAFKTPDKIYTANEKSTNGARGVDVCVRPLLTRLVFPVEREDTYWREGRGYVEI